MERANAKRRNGSSLMRLSTEPTTQIVAVADYENPACVIDGLIRAVIRLALKYNEGVYAVRKEGSKIELENLQIHKHVAEGPLNPDKEINGELFVNALLVELFYRSGQGAMLLDKNKRPYAAQAIGKLYLRMFEVKKVTKERIAELKRVMNYINTEFILLNDSHFAKIMNSSLVPSYIDRCLGTGLPCCRREGGVTTFNTKSTSPLMKFLVMTIQHILVPSGPGVHYKAAVEQIKNLVGILKRKVTKTEAETCDIPQPRETTRTVELKDVDPDDDCPISISFATVDGEPVQEPAYALISHDTTSEHSPAIGVRPSIYSRDNASINTLPPGKDLIDRIMLYLEANNDILSLDDINRIRRWAARIIDKELGTKVKSLEKELTNLKSTYYA